MGETLSLLQHGVPLDATLNVVRVAASSRPHGTSMRKRVIEGPPPEALTARFDVVTYWRRSFSPFKGGNAQPGDVLDIIAQQTVSLNYGDTEKLYFLEATVTNINEDEDWLEAVTTYEHTYEKPYQNVENVAVYDLSLIHI